MESSCEFIEQNIRGQPAGSGPPSLGYGEWLTHPHLKSLTCGEMKQDTDS